MGQAQWKIPALESLQACPAAPVMVIAGVCRAIVREVAEVSRSRP